MLICYSHLFFLSLSRKRRKIQEAIFSYISNPGHPAIPLQEWLKSGSQHPPVAYHTIWPTGHPANDSGTSTGHCPIFPHPGHPVVVMETINLHLHQQLVPSNSIWCNLDWTNPGISPSSSLEDPWVCPTIKIFFTTPHPYSKPPPPPPGAILFLL